MRRSRLPTGPAPAPAGRKTGARGSAPASPSTTRKSAKGARAPVYRMMLIVRETCAVSLAAVPPAMKAAVSLEIPIEVIDAMTPEGTRLLLPLNICAIPSLIVLQDGRRWMAFEDPKELTTRHLVDRISRAKLKPSTFSS